jgi:site-specific DNA-methyltransferase (cytosine-N4-specific)
MLTDRGDLVVDPFGGSCVTGEVAERLGRKWVCVEMQDDYLKGALGRFVRPNVKQGVMFSVEKSRPEIFYKAYNPASIWNGEHAEDLAEDGGLRRPQAMSSRKGSKKVRS